VRELPWLAGLTIAASAVTLAGCGGSGGSSGGASSPSAARVALQDAEATNQSRALLTEVYVCGRAGDHYQRCTTAKELGNTGLPIGKQPGESEVLGKAGSFALVTHSQSGNTFRQDSPTSHSEITRTCTAVVPSPACSANGTW